MKGSYEGKLKGHYPLCRDIWLIITPHHNSQKLKLLRKMNYLTRTLVPSMTYTPGARDMVWGCPAATETFLSTWPLRL